MALILNGTQVVAPTTVTESAVFAGPGSFANIAYVGFSNASATGQIADFSLSIIPEPSTTALLGLGGLLLLRRRRR